MKVRNTFIIFIVSGFWHGANWTFIIWGLINAFYFLPLLVTNRNRNNIEIVAKGKNLPKFKEFTAMVLTFFMAVFAWIFFRSKTVFQAVAYIKGMFSFNFEGKIQYLSIDRYSVELLVLLGFYLFFEWISRENEHPFTGKLKNLKLLVILAAILLLGVYSQASDFIYFQF